MITNAELILEGLLGPSETNLVTGITQSLLNSNSPFILFVSAGKKVHFWYFVTLMTCKILWKKFDSQTLLNAIYTV